MPKTLAPTLEAVLRAVAPLLAPVGRMAVTPGNLPAWDDCCQGQLSLKLREVVPQQRASNLPASCAAIWRVRCGFELVRCAHTLDDAGRPPSADEVHSDGMRMVTDAEDLLAAILALPGKVGSIQNVTAERWSPVGVEGGCCGGEWVFSFVWTGC